MFLKQDDGWVEDKIDSKIQARSCYGGRLRGMYVVFGSGSPDCKTVRLGSMLR